MRIRWETMDDSLAYFADVTPYVTLVVTPDGREWSVECHASHAGQGRWVTIVSGEGPSVRASQACAEDAFRSWVQVMASSDAAQER